MTIEQLRTAYEKLPFNPFSIHLADGREVFGSEGIVGRPELISPDPPHIYAASCRWVRRGPQAFLDLWSDVLVPGQQLPTLPLWLAPGLVLPLGLEESYEQACRDLWIA